MLVDYQFYELKSLSDKFPHTDISRQNWNSRVASQVCNRKTADYVIRLYKHHL